MKYLSTAAFAAMAAFLVAGPVYAADVVVGLVTDGDQERFALAPEVYEEEINALTGSEFQITIPESKRLNGGWDLEGVREALDALLSDPEVDIIIAAGLLAAQEAARMPNLSKPVIAPFVADATLQEFPLENGRSGKRNFVYLSSYQEAEEEIRLFHRATGFKHLAVLVDSLWLEAIPQLKEKASVLAEDMGLQITAVSFADSVEAALDALPAGTDAVYITPLFRLGTFEMRRLAFGLIERKLPSFSLLGRIDLDAGILFAAGGLPADYTRIARRVALNVQRILLGEDAGDIEVAFPAQKRLTINMRTARELGISPDYSISADALLLYDEEELEGRRLSLLGAMQDALELNLELQNAEVAAQLAQDDVKSARSNLLPQFDVSAGAARIDADRANPLFQAEKTTDVELAGSQLIYSERAKAGFDVSRLLQVSADYDLNASVLDTLEASAKTYLAVLRAKSSEGVLESNLEVTRTNLQLARIRESIGFSGLSDVLRWESRIALDRADVLAARATRRQAETELNRVLSRPLDEAFSTLEAGLDEPLDLINDQRFQRFIQNPALVKVFQDFWVREALDRSPELKSTEALLEAQERQVLAARRRFFVPDIGVQASAGSNLSRSGAGSELIPGGPDDEQWTVGIQATLPLYNGGALAADVSRERHLARRLTLQRAAIVRNTEARIRAALQQAGGSYPAIALSRAAAKASARNLELVTDAYSKGAVSVTELIDAQDEALTAELGAAEAVYTFLIDFVEIQRAGADFDLLLQPASNAVWFDSVESYFQERGVKL